jgi:hypothetical protein
VEGLKAEGLEAEGVKVGVENPGGEADSTSPQRFETSAVLEPHRVLDAVDADGLAVVQGKAGQLVAQEQMRGDRGSASVEGGHRLSGRDARGLPGLVGGDDDAEGTRVVDDAVETGGAGKNVVIEEEVPRAGVR